MPRRTAPYSCLRVPLEQLITDGWAVWQARQRGLTFAQAGAELGMSTVTAWRRYWALVDLTTARSYARGRHTPRPALRSTAGCPRGRPWIRGLDPEDEPA